MRTNHLNWRMRYTTITIETVSIVKLVLRVTNIRKKNSSKLLMIDYSNRQLIAMIYLLVTIEMKLLIDKDRCNTTEMNR
jgi:hypothetical protein